MSIGIVLRIATTKSRNADGTMIAAPPDEGGVVSMVVCTVCGASLVATQQFCTSCGIAQATKNGSPGQAEHPALSEALTVLPSHFVVAPRGTSGSAWPANTVLHPDRPRSERLADTGHRNASVQIARNASTDGVIVRPGGRRIGIGLTKGALSTVVLITALASGGTGYAAVNAGYLGFGGAGDSSQRNAVKTVSMATSSQRTADATSHGGITGLPSAADGSRQSPTEPSRASGGLVSNSLATSGTLPSNPDDALTLSIESARENLASLAVEGSHVLGPLRGSWVPQVSSKCEGIAVDIQPNWMPDGVVDTAHVTAEQILGFHLAMGGRFNAITALQSVVGSQRDAPGSGPCVGQSIWVSIVPLSFLDPVSVNAWCDGNRLPVHECAARLIADPGSGKTRVVVRG